MAESRIGVVIVNLPLAIAVVYVKIFIDDPGLRGGHTARLYWPPLAVGLADATIAMIAPEVGSMATSAPCCTFRQARLCCVPVIERLPELLQRQVERRVDLQPAAVGDVRPELLHELAGHVAHEAGRDDRVHRLEHVVRRADVLGERLAPRRPA